MTTDIFSFWEQINPEDTIHPADKNILSRVEHNFDLNCLPGAFSGPLRTSPIVPLYMKAADQGYAEAQSGLGVLYAGGEGVMLDYVQAYMWFDLAGARGHERAAKFLDLVAKLMTAADISKAQRLVAEWLEKHRGKR